MLFGDGRLFLNEIFFKLKYEGPFYGLKKNRGKLTSRGAFDSVQKNNTKSRCVKATENYARAQVPAKRTRGEIF
jgi:hypothetical protein